MKRLTKRQMRIFAVGQLGWSTLSGIRETEKHIRENKDVEDRKS